MKKVLFVLLFCFATQANTDQEVCEQLCEQIRSDAEMLSAVQRMQMELEIKIISHRLERMLKEYELSCQDHLEADTQ